MRLEQLEYFVQTAKHHSMSLAASDLHVSPQNISKAISQLEQELGVTLFTRSKQGAALNVTGEKAFVIAQEILERIALLKSLGEEEAEENVALAGSFSISSSVSLAFLDVYKRQAYGCRRQA